MSLVRGKLKQGYYIRKKNEKVYVSEVKKGSLKYSGKQGKDARRFATIDSAYDYMDEYGLRGKHKVIQVR